jgi:prolipoprotein diacylglyceryl transferase
VLAFVPSPSHNAIHIGRLQLRAYGVLIAIGILAAMELAQRRASARGLSPKVITDAAVWAVPAGLVGARLYSVVTDPERMHSWVDPFKIWQGGLGIWGGIAAGVLAGWWVCRRHGYPTAVLLDIVAPALALAQAIGRWGNYFNQELFGRPTTLPWAVRIDLAHRPVGYEHFSTFHPTFLYESLWDLAVVGIVLLVEHWGRLRAGYLLAVYVAAYTFGRFFTEWLRIDDTHRFLGLRLNDWTSVVVFVGALTLVLTRGRQRDTVPIGSGAAA